VRRRRLIFRSVTLAIVLAGAIALTLAATSDSGFSIGLVLMALFLYVLGVFEAGRLVSALRGTDPDVPPPGRWWICELPKDHKLVRSASSDPTWVCSRCGHVQHVPPPRSIGESVGQGEQAWVPRHDDM
jgi:hypothetical protein